MNRKVLLVQRDPEHLEALSGLFREQGDVVWTAESLKEAGKLVRRYQPDLIIMEVGLFGDNWERAVPAFNGGSSGAEVLFTANGSRLKLFGRTPAERDMGLLRPPYTWEKLEAALQRSQQNGHPASESETDQATEKAGFRFPLRYKITFPYIGLALLLAMAAAYLVTNVVLDSIEERFTNQLIETGRLTAEWMVREEDRLLESLRLVAHTQGVSEAAAAGDAEALRQIALPIAVNANMEAMEILDTRGTSLLALHLRAGGAAGDYQASRGESIYAEWDFVQRTLLGDVDGLGDKFAGVALAPWGNYFYIAGPVRDATNAMVGVVLVGKSLDSMTREIREATVAQVTLYDFKGQQLSTTLLEPADALGPDFVSALRNLQGEQSLLRDQSIADIDYREILTTLEARGGWDVALVGTSLPQAFLVQPSEITRVQIFGLATLAFLAVIAAGVVVSNRITRPLLQVVRASAEVAKGNLTVQVEAGGNDELATLASSFNRMVTALQRSNRELVEAYNTTLEGWSKALELKDEETEGHTQRVTDMTVLLARRMGFAAEELVQIRRGALLHDIGKMGIPDRILNKSGSLSEEEWEIMRKHPLYAYQMLSPIEYLRPALAIPCCHHERWDGSGYPLGWKGEDIPLAARIFSVVDVWDALRSERPYRQPWSDEQVLEHLLEQRGVLFDPHVVDEFIKLISSDEYQDPHRMQTPAMHMATLRRMVPIQ